MDAAGVVKTILLVEIVAMSLLAVLYLRQRRMSWVGYLGWGLLALVIPVIGPFMVIARRPGAWEPEYSFSSDLRRLSSFFQRLLPTAPQGKKISRIDRARQRRQLKQRKASRQDQGSQS